MNVLIIEDEIKTLRSIVKGLEEHGMHVNSADSGYAGLKMALENTYDVIVTDIILPGLSGIELCRELREKNITTPVLMLSALNSTPDKIRGLEIGGDDYLEKPFDFLELMARIRALNRRNTATHHQPEVLTYADLTLYLENKSVERSGKNINLTPKEFSLMEYFIRNKGRVISKSEIADKVWDIQFDTGTNVIEVYINYLRNKIDKDFSKKLIKTKFGLGYYLSEDY